METTTITTDSCMETNTQIDARFNRRPTIIKQRLISTFFILCILLFFPINVLADCQVTLQWDPNTETNIAGYRLFLRVENSSYNYEWPEWEGDTTLCTVPQLDENTVYYFVVRAYDTNGNESGDSNEVRFSYYNTPQPSNNLTPPTDGGGDTADAGGGGCFISDMTAY